ncbi:hypothetical protein B566_EDAN015217 [Ephemera danica]|nr:hypothetical protein B566_EDAN015217 [Ephemera danica]
MDPLLRDPVADLVKTVQTYVPPTWQPKEQAIVDQEVYQIFMVPSGTPEYIEVSSHFDLNFRVLSIRRLQNIYMYGRYMLRNQQLANRNNGLSRETKGFVCINEEHIDQLGHFNVDYRRLMLPPEAFNLYLSPNEARRANTFPEQDSVIIMCRVTRLENNTYNDSELYPEYIIKYNV